MNRDDSQEWNELIDRHLRNELSDAEKEKLAEILDSDPEAREALVDYVHWDTRFADVLSGDREASQPTEPHSAASQSVSRLEPKVELPSERKKFQRWQLAIATVAVIALIANLLLYRPTGKPKVVYVPSSEPVIAEITGQSGPIRWTGNGGRVIDALEVGAKLLGGTVEGMAPDSWFELTFNDGSSATISGNSMLTFSDQGQKELYVKKGNVSCDVNPQPEGKPMLVYTRTAKFEVLGTRFNIDAELSSTTLRVDEGKVHVTRLSDGKSVEVPAKYRVVAGDDYELAAVRNTTSVSRWKSELSKGSVGTNGVWSAQGTKPELKTVPFSIGRDRTLYSSSIRIYSPDSPLVVLQPISKIRLRGRISEAHDVYLGITVWKRNGDFAGRFQHIRRKSEFKDGEDFDYTVDVKNFHLDPSLFEIKNHLPTDPFNLVVGNVWCHSLWDQAGLAITDVELFLPGDELLEE